MSSYSRVGFGLGLDFTPFGLPLGLQASRPPARYLRHQRSSIVMLVTPCLGHGLGLG